MAFTDTLLDETDASVVIVDHHHAPGGHWNDAYPFVRLHQPSAFYGVNSTPLGEDVVDTHGSNAGLFELASGAEVCSYFDHIMRRRFLPSGRVRYFPMSSYEESGQIRSLVSGNTFRVEASRAVVDATYMNVKVPSVHRPSYAVGDGISLIPPNALPRAKQPASGYVVVGAGKTAIDACLWLLEQGVDPDVIRWVVPRDSWLLDRAKIQPGDGFKLREQFPIIAEATSIDAMFAGLEAGGHLLRLDPTVRPTLYRCATVTSAELESLRRIRGVVRQGRVQRIDASEVVLDHGTLPCDSETLFIDCSADGLERRPTLPVFNGAKITLQTVRPCQQAFSAALIGHIEAVKDDESEKNTLCAAAPHPDSEIDFLHSTLANAQSLIRWSQDPDVLGWLMNARLNAARALKPGDPAVAMAALAKLQSLIADLPEHPEGT
jgi:hypothetical protein